MDKRISKELFSKKVVVRGKTFFVEVKENQRGKYLKIAELSNDKRSGIFIPFEDADKIVIVIKEAINSIRLNS